MKTVILTLLLVSARVVQSVQSLAQAEYLALYSIFNATNGVHWEWDPGVINGVPWVFTATADPCTDNWQGVNCSIATSPPPATYHVSLLDLSSHNMTGTLPDVLGNLGALQVLELDGNFIAGKIPLSMCALTQLEMLNLDKNRFTGHIPECIGNLELLTALDLGNNPLGGTIPVSMGNLYRLTQLYLNENQLTGPIPHSFGNLSHLVTAEFEENILNGTLPATLCNLTGIQTLFLHENQLSGSIPDCVGDLAELTELDLCSNQLKGTLPATIASMQALQLLYLCSNHLTGTIPASLSLSPSLLVINVEHNLLKGSIPAELMQLKTLTGLILDYNELTGSLPASIDDATRLEYISAQNNMLTGSLPSSMCQLSAFGYLTLDNNMITGSLPECIDQIEHISYISIQNNLLTGTIPYIGGLQRLNTLLLNTNAFTGTLPVSIAKLRSLITLGVKDNYFVGSLEGVFNSTTMLGLITVSLDSNEFTGQLPPVVFELPQISTFSMVGSCLHGTLPDNICNATHLEALILYGLSTGKSCRAKGVQSLSQQHQHTFGGTLPSCVLGLPNLVTLFLSSNRLTGSISTDAIIGTKLLELDLSHNELIGPIPTSVQNRSWAVIDLSHNKLNGVLQSNAFAVHNHSVQSSFTVTGTSTSVKTYSEVSLSTNRLSGPVPSTIMPLYNNLSVLAGNLFECKYDKSNLPQHDSDVSNYQCASNAFDIAIYVWLGLGACAVALCCVVYFKYKHVLSAPLQFADEYAAKLSNVYILFEKLSTVASCALYCAAFCLLVLVPYYAIVSHYEGTHTHQYAYVLSAIYVSGVVPFVFDVLLLAALIALLLCCVAVARRNDPSQDITNATAAPNDNRWQRAYVWCSFAAVNVTVVLGANIAFVYIVLYQSSQVQTLAQILLSLFKLAWSTTASPNLMRQLDAYFMPPRDGPAEPYFALQLLVALFNNIAIPCLVVAAIDPNCFSNVLLPPQTQTVAYFLLSCERNEIGNGPCIDKVYQFTTLEFTPPFTYSYQCSASFITSYAPAFIYMSMSTVFLSPLLQYVLLRLYERLPTGSMAHRLVTYFLPRILKAPLVLSGDITSSAAGRKRSIVGAVGILVTLLTQLGILLTFGAIFPPVALAMAVSISAIVFVARHMIQRFVHAVVKAQLPAYLDIINTECERVGTREQMRVAVVIIICYCCAFYTLFLFDTLGDAVGFDASVWVLIVVPIFPFAIFGSEEFFRKYFAAAHGENFTKASTGSAVELAIVGVSDSNVDNADSTTSVLHTQQV